MSKKERSQATDAKNQLLLWYGEEAIFLDSVKNDKGILHVTRRHCAGHFKKELGRVLPGHIIIEAAAQLLVLLAHERSRDKDVIPLLGSVRAQFKKPVLPGDILTFTPALEESSSRKFDADIKVARGVIEVAVVGLTIFLVEKKEAQKLLS